jgi:hypothetical protein
MANLSTNTKENPSTTEKLGTKENPIITIDGVAYHLSDLSDIAKQQLGSLRATDVEIARLEAQLAMLKTARIAYARAAKEELAN